jgi:hypothetical protein
MAVTAMHPLKLVAPWYRWARQAQSPTDPRDPRRSRPVFQKFEGTDFVQTFCRDPQRSLQFIDDIDTVFKPTAVADSTTAGRVRSLFKSAGTRFALVPTGMRKMYLEIHKRYYLVVCELHCDLPGFPTAAASEICQAGFVVRRRSFDFPGGRSDQRQATAFLQQIVAVQAHISDLQLTAPAKGMTARRRANEIAKMKAAGTFEPKLAELNGQLAALRQQLRDWRDANGVTELVEGWEPGPFKNIGSWQTVEETPSLLTESSFPMYPLFADPKVPDHSGRGKTIYFGVFPTSSFDTDERGTARFDDANLYEIRCFVRQPAPGCPPDPATCHGPLTWSEPTEPYKLAATSDLIGTSQRPITIQMPDLQELAAQVATLPVKQLAPVKVVQPQALNFSVDKDGNPKSPSVGAFKVCFFAIPLITLVAFFVLNIFLPILVFLFGLFFLLQLKFCIPPSISLSAGLKAELDLVGNLSVSAAASIDLDVALVGSPPPASLTIPGMRSELLQSLRDEKGIDPGSPADVDLKTLSNNALVALAAPIAVSQTFQDDPNAAGPQLTAALLFEPRVTVEMKVA